MRSLQRTLAVRLSGTMFLALSAVALWTYETAARGVLYRMVGIVLLGSVATMIGTAWLATSAVAPIKQIAAQATAATGGATGARITAHPDVAEFAGLIAVLNDMLTRLDRANAWHREIIRDLSHDLRTPITAMRAGVEVALWTERSTEEYRRVLAGTLEEIDRLTLISDAFRFLGRLEAGELTVNLTALDVQAVANEAVTHAKERGGTHHFSLTCRGHAAPTQADARLLTVALDQLLDNAVRHTPPGTKIAVSVATENSHAELVVEDDGPGVPDDLLPCLFEPFYRTDAARGRDSGGGLGLTVATKIVHLHHGTIHAERGGAGGLRVRIWLPQDNHQEAAA